MNILGLLLGVLTAISLLLTGCQPTNPSEVTRLRRQMGTVSNLPKVEVNEASLSGTWVRSCAQDEERSGLYSIHTYTITSNYADSTKEFFLDKTCTTKAYVESLSGYFKIDAESKMLLEYASLSILPQVSIIAASLNQKGSMCNLTDWAVGNIKTFGDVTVCGYKTSTQTKVQRFGSNELFIGETKFLKP